MVPELPVAGTSVGGPLVIGLGNEHRADDAVGLWVARRLVPRLAGIGRVLELSADGTRLLEAWSGLDFVVVVDALTSGQPPGTVRRLEVGAEPLPASLGTTSTHGLSLAAAVALGQSLASLPRRLVIYGIEGARFGPGDRPSPAVEAAVPGVVDRVEAEVRRAVAPSPRPRAGASGHA